MAKRGRKSLAEIAAMKAAEHAVKEPGALPGAIGDFVRKPHPAPPELSKIEAKIWRKIVNDLPVDWFSEGDIPLLVAYCQQYALLNRVRQEAESQALVVYNPKTGAPMQNPIFAMQSRISGSLSTLSTKLRLSQSTRLTPGAAGTKARNHVAANVAEKKPWEL